jgi:hypothetical protein
MMKTNRLIGLSLVLATALAPAASASTCMNKFISHSDHARQVVTLLSGLLTYDEARSLASSGRASSIEWLDDKGKPVAKAAELHVVRPMPGGCDGKTSGVVVIATFLTAREPAHVMYLKVDNTSPVPFTQQN